MKMLHPPSLDAIAPCPYLEGREKQYRYFYAIDLNYRQVDSLLENGWRKFGPCFFRPACPDCLLCIPIRVDVDRFVASRSQKRVLKKGKGLRVEWGELRYSKRIFEIYRTHSLTRFGDDVEHEDFINAFYIPTCPGMQIDIFIDDLQIGVGWLDRGKSSFSSIYFCFDPEFSHLNLGSFSILQEIRKAQELGCQYYYLGYWVPGSSRMAYKDTFTLREHLDWLSKDWREVKDEHNKRTKLTDNDLDNGGN